MAALVAPVGSVERVVRVAASASASASATSLPPDEGPDDTCGDSFAAAALAEVERAKATGDRAQMRASLEAYLDLRAKDVTARRAFMNLCREAGDLDAAETHASVLVELEGGPDEEAWLILSQAAQARGETEPARAMLARAAVLRPAGQAAQLLGARSRCTSIERPRSSRTPLGIAQDWRAAFAVIEPSRMVHEDLPDPTTEAEARRRVCVSGDLQAIVARDVCAGPGPWDVLTGHMDFHDMVATIAPLPKGRLGIVSFYTGDQCRGGMSFHTTRKGNVVIVTGEEHGLVNVSTGSCDDGQHDMLSGPCITSTIGTTTYFDAATGAVLLALEEHREAEHHVIAGPKVHRTGDNGCDDWLPLDAKAAP